MVRIQELTKRGTIRTVCKASIDHNVMPLSPETSMISPYPFIYRINLSLLLNSRSAFLGGQMYWTSSIIPKLVGGVMQLNSNTFKRSLFLPVHSAQHLLI